MKMRTITINSKLYTRSVDLLKLIDMELKANDDAVNEGALNLIEHNLICNALKRIKMNIVLGAVRYDQKHGTSCTNCQLQPTSESDVPDLPDVPGIDSPAPDAGKTGTSKTNAADAAKEASDTSGTSGKADAPSTTKAAEPAPESDPEHIGRYAVGRRLLDGAWMFLSGVKKDHPRFTVLPCMAKRYVTWREANAALDFIDVPGEWHVLDWFDNLNAQQRLDRAIFAPVDADEGNEDSIPIKVVTD